MKAIAETLGVARSNLAEQARRDRRARPPNRKADDPAVLAAVRGLVDERPTYGYRRITALLNRQRRQDGLPCLNHKPIYRIMRLAGLLLERHSGRRPGRVHDGKVAVMRSNLRWCSDTFEIACWNNEIVRVGFSLDGHDREAISWLGVAGGGISGSDVRDMMLEAVEKRFGSDRAPHPEPPRIFRRLVLLSPKRPSSCLQASESAALRPRLVGCCRSARAGDGC